MASIACCITCEHWFYYLTKAPDQLPNHLCMSPLSPVKLRYWFNWSELVHVFLKSHFSPSKFELRTLSLSVLSCLHKNPRETRKNKEHLPQNKSCLLISFLCIHVQICFYILSAMIIDLFLNCGTMSKSSACISYRRYCCPTPSDYYSPCRTWWPLSWGPLVVGLGAPS